MISIIDICSYIISNYPNKDDLSNARLTKMIYLSDWVSAIKNDKQLTNIGWYYDNYGPFVWDILNSIKEHDDIFKIEHTNNMYGGEKRLVTLKHEHKPKIKKKNRKIIDGIISKTKDLYWNEFIKLVYSTYPILSSDKYSPLNLVEKARELNAIKHAR